MLRINPKNPMNSASRLTCWLVMEALIIAHARGETNQEDNSASAANDPFVPFPGVFNTELPRMTLPANLRVSLRPRFNDLRSKDHMRLVWALRYGVSPQWELSADIDSYLAHGLGDRSLLDTNGVSRVRVGAKYRFAEFLQPFWDTAAGFNYSTPIENSPEELTDGLRHIEPYMTMEHVLERHPSVSCFISYGFDFTEKALPRVTTNQHYGADTWFITPGLTWRRAPFKYTLEVTFRSSLGLDESGTYDISVRPGVAWTLPQSLTFNSRSRWVVGLGLNATQNNDGMTFGISTRVQTNFDFKRMFYTPKAIAAWR